MSAVKHNIYIEQSATFYLSMRFGTLLLDGVGQPVLDGAGNPQIDVPRDFTDCTARMQVRVKASDELALLTVTTEDTDGGITLDANGNVVVEIPDEVTVGLIVTRGVYDLKVYNPDGTEDRLVQGTATVSKGVTRDA